MSRRDIAADYSARHSIPWWGEQIAAVPAVLRREAQALQAAWFAEPASLARQEEYAYALLAWGRTTKTRRAIQHAERLLGCGERS